MKKEKIMLRFCIVILFSIFVFSCSDDDSSNNDNLIVFEPLFPCENGFADIYPCNDYDLMSFMSNNILGGDGAEGNDSWGWTDSTTEKEYALIGTSTGTAFVDITNPTQPILLGTLESANISDPTGNIWRDIKVYNNYAFIVSEAENHGMQVFDLTKLRNVTNPPQVFIADTNYNEFGKAHNIVINKDSGFAYAVGTDTYDGGPHFINIQNPLNPIFAGGYAIDGYTHDAQVVTYNGPDSDYIGQEIFIGSNGNELIIVNVTDKANPTNIFSVDFTNTGFVHQGWFTDDMTYFILGNETDEINFGNNTKTIVLDLTDLDNPIFKMEYLSTFTAIDHNGYVKGNLLYLANYTAGVRIIDITNIASNSMNEVGFFDTYPENNDTDFKSAWNAYPYFPSGNIIISTIDSGLFIIRKSEE